MLLLLVFGTTLPLTVFGAWLVRSSWMQRQALVDRQNVEQARAVSVAIDQEVGRTIASLNVLALLEPIETPDKTYFTTIASRTLPLHSGWTSIRLVNAAHEVVADTELKPERATLILPDWVDAVFRTRQPAVSNVRQDPVTGRWFVSIGVPVTRDGRVVYALGVRVLASAFSGLLQRQQAPTGGVITLLDRQPAIIARTKNEERFVGRSPTPDFVAVSRTNPEGTWRSVTLEGVRSYSSWSRSALTGWTVGNAMAADAVEGPMRRSLLALVLTGVLTLAAGLLLAGFLTRGLVRSGELVASGARALARGEPLPRFHAPIVEAQELSHALEDAAAILATRLRERDEAQAELDRSRAALLEREQSARRTAEALSLSKDEFVATVSHELRTPLNAILGWVTLLRSTTTLPDREQRALEIIERNTRAQAKLIEDLLEMSRVLRGGVQLELHPLDLGALLASAIDSVRPAAAGRSVEIVAAAVPGGIIVTGDRSRLQQVFWNLLTNALKFTPTGGKVTVSLGVDGRNALVTVADTGEGIAPEFLPLVFDRFSQEARGVTRVHSGLGIGLSLVRDLVELHGGSVTASSAGKEQGATFTVRLPLATSDRDPAASSSPRA